MDLTINMIKDMQHAIGMRRERIKRYKYVAFRNYFFTAYKHSGWKYLEKEGYATSRNTQHGIYYHVTDKGLRLLEAITFIKITEMD